MKLLLDENLSRRMVPFLQQDYPDSSQVVLVGLQSATDLAIWEYAKEHGFVVVTRDIDFVELSLLKGQPPKLIRLRVQNQSRAAILNILLKNQQNMTQVLISDGQACVEIMHTLDID
jgi:predicted nuclease of predicted toxin-antitoxin system